MLFRIFRQKVKYRAAGYRLLIATVLALIAAWNTGTNLYYIVFAGLCGFAILAHLFGRAALRGVVISREAPQAVYRGDRFPVMMRVVNPRRFMSAYTITIERTVGEKESLGFIPALPPKRQASLRAIECMEQRGVHKLPDVVLISGFPFGFVERHRRVSDSTEIVVYPRIRAVRAAAIEDIRNAGSVSRRVTDGGDEFFSLRQYVPGDDLRKVAWHASARVGSLLVKEMGQESSKHVACILDNRDNPSLEHFSELFEEAVELTASLAVTLLYRHYRVAIVTADELLPPGEGPHQVTQTLEMLARLQTAPSYAVNPFMRSLPGKEWEGRRSLCVSPDPAVWGKPLSGGGRVLHPSEVVHA